MEFGEKIRDYRRRSGMTQKDLALKLGWDQNRVSRLENGNRKSIDIKTAQSLSSALGQPLEFISPEFAIKKSNIPITPREAIKIMYESLPVEIPIYLQSQFINFNEPNFWIMEYATAKGIGDGDTDKNGNMFGIVSERYYDLPAIDLTDILILDKSRTPREPVQDPGYFNPNIWSNYYRVLVRTPEVNGMTINPALWIGHGKVFLKPSDDKGRVFSFGEYEFIATISSRRIYFKDSKVETLLAQSGIVKTPNTKKGTTGYKQWMPASMLDEDKRIDTKKYLKDISSALKPND